MNNGLIWNVKEYDSNAHKIIDINILKFMIPHIKELKKKSENREKFSKELRHEMMYHFWSKCEHELIIEIKDSRVFLRPWIGNKEVFLDVTDDKNFDWMGFAKKHINEQIFKNRAKIDVFDQLQYYWDKFVDYCWYTHLPYERKNSKFEKPNNSGKEELNA